MTSPFNPLDHPAIFRVPAWLPESGAWHEHLPFAFFLIDVLRPQVLVEIGTADGAAYTAFCQALDAAGLTARCTAVTTAQGAWRQQLQTRYSRFARVLPRDPREAAAEFADGTIDLLHFAGAPTAEDAAEDAEDAETGLAAWLPKLSVRGVVLVTEPTAWPGWAGLKGRYPPFEMPHGCGLGLLAVGAQAAPELAALLALPEAEAARLGEFFFQASRAYAPDSPQTRAWQQQLAKQQQETRSLHEQLAARSQHVQRLQLQGAQLKQALSEMAENYAKLGESHAALINSDAWWFVNQYWALRRLLIPPGSRREKGLKQSVRLSRILKILGPAGTLLKLKTRLLRRGPVTAHEPKPGWMNGP